MTWSHIVELLKIDDPLERGFNERQALHERWSVRELVRQKAYVFEFLKIPEPYHAGIEYATYGMSSQLFVQKYSTSCICRIGRRCGGSWRRRCGRRGSVAILSEHWPQWREQ